MVYIVGDIYFSWKAENKDFLGKYQQADVKQEVTGKVLNNIIITLTFFFSSKRSFIIHTKLTK